MSKRWSQILSVIVLLTMSFFALNHVSIENHQYVDNEYIKHVSSYEEALSLAESYDIELIDYSSYGIATYQNKGESASDLLDLGFSYNGISTILNGPPLSSTDDPYLQNQYGLTMTRTIETWALTEGLSTVTIAIIDTGIDIDHPEFEGRISPLSKNVVTGAIGLSAVDDDYGHGTMVAGVIGANKDNGIGIAGMTQNTQLLVIKTNQENEGTYQDRYIIEGIYYAVEHGADVINLSLGSTYDNPMTEEAVDFATAQGVVVVASAGNDGDDRLQFPASFEQVISVGAVDDQSDIATYSNHNRAVDLSAPGSEIVTTDVGGGYTVASGTSFAAPHVVGLIALYISYFEDYSADEIKDKLYASSVDLGTLDWDPYFGHGLIDAYNMFTADYRKVTYIVEDMIFEPDYVLSGSTLGELPEPYVAGKIFLGWYMDSNYLTAIDPDMVINEDITIYGLFTNTYHTVTFVTEGEPLPDQIVAHGNGFTPPDSVRDGYHFIGWYLEPEFVTPYQEEPLYDDLTLYAKFEAIIYYDVYYYIDGEVYAQMTFEENTYPSLPEINMESYEFMGWYLDPDFITLYESSPLTSNLILYGRIKPILHTLTLVIDGAIETMDVLHLTLPNIPDPIKEDESFAGWYLDPELTVRYQIQAMTEDLTLYAKFLPITYRIDLYLDNEIYDIIYVNQGDIPILPEIVSEGYRFSGWYVDSAYQTPYESKEIYQQLALYGKLERLYFMINFYNGDGEVAYSELLPWGERINYPAMTYKTSTISMDYVFSHWSSDAIYAYESMDIYPVFDKRFNVDTLSFNPGVDTIFVGEAYNDASIELLDTGLRIVTESTIDVDKPGKYEVIYRIYDQADLVYSISRYVRVIDPLPNVIITLNPGLSTLFVGQPYVEAGATTNLGDVVVKGDVNPNVAGLYEIVYEVTYGDRIFQKTRIVTIVDRPTAIIPDTSLTKEEDQDA